MSTEIRQRLAGLLLREVLVEKSKRYRTEYRIGPLDVAESFCCTAILGQPNSEKANGDSGSCRHAIHQKAVVSVHARRDIHLYTVASNPAMLETFVGLAGDRHSQRGNLEASPGDGTHGIRAAKVPRRGWWRIERLFRKLAERVLRIGKLFEEDFSNY